MWSPEKWQRLEQVAQEYGLFLETGSNVHLKRRRGLTKQEIASIHTIGEENDICIHPDYERGMELLEALGTQVFGASIESGRTTGARNK